MIPAVANAVHDALGVRIDEVPMTPDKVILALRAASRGREPRFGPERIPEFDYPEVIRVEPPAEFTP